MMKRALLDEDMIAVALNFPISEYKDVTSVCNGLGLEGDYRPINSSPATSVTQNEL